MWRLGLVLGFLALVAVAVEADPTEYWLFNSPYHHDTPRGDSTLVLANSGSSAHAATVSKATGPVGTYSVPPGGYVTIDLDGVPPMGSAVTDVHTYRVETDGEVGAVVYEPLVQVWCFCEDSLSILPQQRLGTTHMALKVGEGFNTAAGPMFANWHVIIATEDATTVTVASTGTVEAGPGVAAMGPGGTQSITLSRFESAVIHSKGDMTGSLFTSDKPVAAFNVYQTDMEADGNDWTSSAEQLEPIPEWGTGHVVCSSARNRPGTMDVVRVIGSTGGTTVVVDPVPASLGTGSVALAAAGDWFEFTLDPTEDAFVSADLPVTVIQQMWDGGPTLGDPVHIRALGMQHWDDGYVMPTLHSDTGWLHTIAVAAPRGASVTVDGMGVTSMRDVGLTGYQCGMETVVHGVHRVAADTPFTATAYRTEQARASWYVAEPTATSGACHAAAIPPADAPLNPWAVPLYSPAGARVSWLPPPSAATCPILGYEVERRLLSWEPWVLVATITGDPPATMYVDTGTWHCSPTYRIRAFNAFGAGPYSDETMPWTDCHIPPPPPPPPPPVEEEPVDATPGGPGAADADGDGWPDGADRCPGTWGDDEGCPSGGTEPVPPPSCTPAAPAWVELTASPTGATLRWQTGCAQRHLVWDEGLRLVAVVAGDSLRVGPTLGPFWVQADAGGASFVADLARLSNTLPEQAQVPSDGGPDDAAGPPPSSAVTSGGSTSLLVPFVAGGAAVAAVTIGLAVAAAVARRRHASPEPDSRR